MKYLFFLFLLFPVLSFAQEGSSKSSKARFVVLGECELCKDRIQRATYKIKGVKYSSWSISQNKLSIIYNSNKVSLEEIKKKIADAGHDSEDIRATDEAYANLHQCCKYDREKQL